jgi:insertion element IS1 protein InsB
MKCQDCKAMCIKWGKQVNGKQRYYCKHCKRHQQSQYRYQACEKDIEEKIIMYKKESCGIRSISRIMKISASTVMKKIVEISKKVQKPTMIKGKEYEMDEMRTYIKSKENRYWIAYAKEEIQEK